MLERRYLITGGSGKLGQLLQAKVSSLAPTRQQLDILNLSQLEREMEDKSLMGVIHLAAITAQKYAESHKEESYRVNVLGTRSVAEAAARRGLKIFYTSTDYVFDGAIGDYREEDLPSPPNWYGFTKYAGELEIRQTGKAFCILRTSFRPQTWGFPTAFTNVYTSADYIDVIADEIERCIKMDIEGIIHIGTPVKSFYQLAIQRNPTVKPEECTDAGFPKRRNLNIDRWLSLKKGALCAS